MEVIFKKKLLDTPLENERLKLRLSNISAPKIDGRKPDPSGFLSGASVGPIFRGERLLLVSGKVKGDGEIPRSFSCEDLLVGG